MTETTFEPSEAQITAALAAAAFFDTPESRKDMRKALIAAAGAVQMHPLDALLPEFASFMDMAKVDFTDRGLWTEYDQGLRDRITAYNLNKLGATGVLLAGPDDTLEQVMDAVADMHAAAVAPQPES
jgi:hypothetical protein